ncbi:MAG: phosphatidate cytidylyltransferase [Tannerella sp.]|nr:phosphatidate cytidylyltransferase [Tannerella sp.]
MKNLITRALTGIIFVAVIAGGVYIHPYTFLGLFVLIVGLTLWEFYGFVNNNIRPVHKITGILSGMYLFAASFFYAGGYVPSNVFLPYLFFLLLMLITGLYHKSENSVNDWAIGLFAQFYCAGLFSLLNFIAFSPDYSYNPHYVLLIFIFVWLNDTGAYLVGSTMGKHRLFPRISPLKSWEGFWGGLIVTIAASQLIAWCFPGDLMWYDWLFISILVVLFGTWGDLVESLMKRTYGVKDSGRLLPGHGGIQDRLDSVMLATPAVFLYMEFFIRN